MYRLVSNIHACLVGETPVLLDITAGRYQLARGRTGCNLAAFLRKQATGPVCEALVRGGLIVSAPHTAVRHPEPERPNYAHPQDTRLGLGWALLPVAMTFLVMAIIRVRRMPLPDLVQSLQEAASYPMKPPFLWVSEARIAAIFYLTRTVLPLRDRCLPYSLATAQMLRLFGHRPTIVIGVRLPIAAHCWVQCDHRLIGDTLHIVEGFQPIIAI
ncbi:MAG: lasso peptide biosynthesis B2 protein [Sphingomonadaceae bacterium]|nr:lasso peptide biosynthesis B2 protein [Sphingomonadaceae bacterium]